MTERFNNCLPELAHLFASDIAFSRFCDSLGLAAEFPSLRFDRLGRVQAALACWHGRVGAAATPDLFVQIMSRNQLVAAAEAVARLTEAPLTTFQGQAWRSDIKTMGALMVQDRARLVDEIASKWRDICPRLEIDPQQIESRLPRGATPYECANKFVETVWNMNISVSSFYYACRRAEFELAGRVDWIRPIGATGAATSAPYTATVQQVVAHEESKTGSLAANAALAAIDEEDDVPTMRTVFSIPGHKTVALLIAALDTDTCKEVLFQPQETERLRAAFVEIYNTLVTEQRADANYNMAFNMLRMLCQTNKFGAMPVVEFVQTLFAGIKKLQKTVAKIVKEHDETARRQTSSIKAATDKLIDWNNLLLSGDYSLKPNTNPKSVIAALEELGVAKIDDLEHVDVDDLVQCGLNKVSAKKLKKLVDEQTATATATAVTMDDD